MTTAVVPRATTVVRNTVWNIIGGAVYPVVGMAVVPLMVRGLGTERYGLWALAGSVLGYFIVFDLGLGRSVTKFVSEALAKGERGQVPQVFWTALLASLALGTLGGLAFLLAVPFLTSRLLRISPDLAPEARAFLAVFSAFAPIYLCQRTVGALLEASHRFDLSNAVGVPARVVSLLLPLIGVWLGWPLAGVGALAILAGVGGLLATFAVALRVRPEVGEGIALSMATLRRVVGFGGWMMGASILALLVAGSDRVIIGAVLSAKAVAYYAPSQSLIGQMYIIPGAIYATLFPAFSALWNVDEARAERLYASAFKILALAMGAIAIMLIVFARDLLTLWLGPEFAGQSTRVLQVLGVTLFLNTLAWVPSTALQGVGRPDLVAKIFLVETPFYLGLAVLLTREMGIVGTALAWAGRSVLDTLLFPVVAWRATGLSPLIWVANSGIKVGMLLGGLAVGMLWVHLILPSQWTLQELGVAAGLVALFALLGWRFVLTQEERGAVARSIPIMKEIQRWL